MSINSVPASGQPAVKAQPQNAAPAEKAEGETSLSIRQQSTLQMNKSILEASLNVSISAGNESLSLAYKAAAEKINELLEPDLGPRAVDTAVESGLDVSPEATADRIVSLTTALFDRYRESNPDLGEAELADRFTEVIGGGILQGFNEAREILDGMGVLGGDIESNIDETYALVTEKLEQFRLDQGGTPRETTESVTE